jgi:transposase
MFVIIWDDWRMAKRYRPVRRDQPFLLPPSMRDWLPPGHPVWLVITAVEEHLDTSAFHAARRTGGAGTAGYDPDMLVCVLVWAYAHQVTSSRRIEELCRTDVAFRVICGGQLPDHVTIARFRAGFPGAAAVFFAQVLALCARLGMGKLGVVALDGMKIAANASKSANRTEESLRKLAARTVAAHGETDAAEDDLFGAGRRGDEVPRDAWSPRQRAGRIAAALASLQTERQAADARQEQREREHLDAAKAGTPRREKRPPGAAVELAEMKVQRAQAVQQARVDAWDAAVAGGARPRGPRPAPADGSYVRIRQALAQLGKAKARAAAAQAQAPAAGGTDAGGTGGEDHKDGEADGGGGGKDGDRPRGPVRNITDPDARLMPVRGGGFIEGYNTQNVTSEDGLIIATDLTCDTTDAPSFEPMLRRAEDAAAFITAHRPAAAGPQPPGGSDGLACLIKLFLSDAGYLSEHNLTIPGPDRLIATGKTRGLQHTARAPRRSGGTAAGLATEDGITAYRQRGHIAETPHGQIKHNMRFRQLSVRSKPKATAEWTFTCTVHNLFKAITAGHLTTTALATLASQPAIQATPA